MEERCAKTGAVLYRPDENTLPRRVRQLEQQVKFLSLMIISVCKANPQLNLPQNVMEILEDHDG